MATFNFPVYSKDELFHYKHITPSKCIIVGLESIKTVDFISLFGESRTTTNGWDDVINLTSTIITKAQFDEVRNETINQLIKD